MKKTKPYLLLSISIILLNIFMALIITLLPISASNRHGDGIYTFSVADGYATIIGITNNSINGKITIPSTLGNYPVMHIGDQAFIDCKKITEIYLPDTIKSIGNFAFKGCSDLKYINLPNGINTIGNGCFSECSSLESIVIPSSITEISAAAFSQCTALKKITIQSGVERIVSSAFVDCLSLESIHIPSSINDIAISSFSHCPAISSISVDNNNPIYHALGNCLIETESKMLLLGCKESSIPTDGSVISISPKAFYGCSELENINIPNTVASIGYGAFASCTNLTSVNIPNSVNNIEERAFEGCENLSNIQIDKNNTDYHTASDLIIETKSKTLIHGGKNGHIPADESVTNIAGYAFSLNNSLVSLQIPSHITDISPYAFYCCSNLSKVTFEEGSQLKALNSLVFYYCQNLYSVTFERNSQLNYIDSYAFHNCKKISSITIPEGTKFNSDVFIEYDKYPSINYLQTNNTSENNSDTSSGCNSNIIENKILLLIITLGTSVIYLKKRKHKRI